MRIVMVTDAWRPQVNGVVHTLERLAETLKPFDVGLDFLTPNMFRTLPLPTYVRVTNLENGRRIIVKVNDRGPFKQDRLIDLSYVAAKKLEMTGRGTALVEVKVIDLDNQHRSNKKHKTVLASPHRQKIIAHARKQRCSSCKIKQHSRPQKTARLSKRTTHAT